MALCTCSPHPQREHLRHQSPTWSGDSGGADAGNEHSEASNKPTCCCRVQSAHRCLLRLSWGAFGCEAWVSSDSPSVRGTGDGSGEKGPSATMSKRLQSPLNALGKRLQIREGGRLYTKDWLTNKEPFRVNPIKSGDLEWTYMLLHQRFSPDLTTHTQTAKQLSGQRKMHMPNRRDLPRAFKSSCYVDVQLMSSSCYSKTK